MALTPTQLESYARQRYNATGDNFFSEGELLNHIWAAQMELATKALCVRQVFTTPSVASQQEYTAPSTLLGIYRATYDGEKLEVTSLDQVLRETEGLSVSSGFSDSIAHWGSTFYLAPIPSESAKTIKIWAFVEPQEVTATSSLEVPARHQFKLVNYLLAHMAYKDNNFNLGDRYMKMWDADVDKARQEEILLFRTGGFQTVGNEDYLYGVE